MDQQAIYMEMYKECCTQGRHHETQRSTITTVCFALVGATVAYIYKEGGPKHDLLAPCIFLMVLGLFAAILSYKQYERFRLAMDQASQYRNAIDNVVSPTAPAILTPSIATLRGNGRALHASRHPVLGRLKLHHMWGVLFLLIALLGCWMSFLAYRIP